MVVNEVDKQGDAAAMAFVNERFKVVWGAVGVLDSERKDAVISPVSGSRKLANRHQLNGVNSEFRELANPA